MFGGASWFVCTHIPSGRMLHEAFLFFRQHEKNDDVDVGAAHDAHDPCSYMKCTLVAVHDACTCRGYAYSESLASSYFFTLFICGPPRGLHWFL